MSPRPNDDAPAAVIRLELATAISALRAQPVADAQVTALARRLAMQLSTPSVHHAAASGGTSSPWLQIATGYAVAVGLGWYLMVHMHGTSAPRAPRSLRRLAPAGAAASPVPILQAASVRPEATEPREAREAPPLAMRVSHGRVRATPSTRPRTDTSAPTARSDAAGELSLLQHCQALLDRDPQQALSLTHEHEQRYLHGVFEQEREILAIESLLKLHDKPRALLRARAFIDHFADSPHARRVRALLERSQAEERSTTGEPSVHSSDEPKPERNR